MVTAVAIKKRAIKCSELRDGLFVDFESGDPQMVSDVSQTPHMVLFTANGTKFSLDKDEIIYQVTVMRLVEE